MKKTNVIIEEAINKVKVELERIIRRDLPPVIQSSLLPIAGKLNRARLLLTFAALGGGINPRSIKLAVAVELLHWASLIQDDVIDGAKWRRNKPSINYQHGAGISFLISDWMFSETYNRLLQCDGDAVKLINQTIKVMALSELDQELKLADNHVSTYLEYFRYIYKKTAVFFKTCCILGINSAGNNRLLAVQAGRIGFWWGIAYQLTDDIKDLINGGNGLNTSEDFTKGLYTLPLIFLNQRYPIAEKNYTLAEITELLEKTDIIARCLEIRNKCLKKTAQLYKDCFAAHAETSNRSIEDWLSQSISETSLIS